MKLFIILQIFVFVLTLHIFSQDNATITPEYEATRQTEKLQQELNLTSDQVKLVYEINLKYARARQNSSSRSEAMQRVKNKDADLEKVLSTEQINKLHTKRYERSVYQPAQTDNFKSNGPVQRINPPARRSSSEMRTTESRSGQNTDQSPAYQRRMQMPVDPQVSTRSSNSEHSTRPSVQSQSSVQPRREQTVSPPQQREAPAQTPQGNTESRRR